MLEIFICFDVTIARMPTGSDVIFSKCCQKEHGRSLSVILYEVSVNKFAKKGTILIANIYSMNNID